MIKNKTIKKKLVSFILSVCMVLTATSIPVVSAISTKTEKAGVSAETTSANRYGLASNIQEGTILHCLTGSIMTLKLN